jgi:hypothetical protein
MAAAWFGRGRNQIRLGGRRANSLIVVFTYAVCAASQHSTVIRHPGGGAYFVVIQLVEVLDDIKSSGQLSGKSKEDWLLSVWL